MDLNWLKELIRKNPFLALLIPTGLGSFTFFSNLVAALSDGNIDSNELHQLTSSASGLEIIILIIVMLALKGNKKK